MADSDAPVDEFLNNALGLVAEYGWQVTGVGAGGGDPQFAYTAGLTGQGRPELVIAGLGFENMQKILNTVGELGPVEDGAVLDGVLGGGLQVRIRSGKPTGALHPGTAFALYGDAVRLQQVLWPDKAGRFPGEPGFALAHLQPLLERGS